MRRREWRSNESADVRFNYYATAGNMRRRSRTGTPTSCAALWYRNDTQALALREASVNSVLEIRVLHEKAVSDRQQVALECSVRVRLAGLRLTAVGTKVKDDAAILLLIAAGV